MFINFELFSQVSDVTHGPLVTIYVRFVFLWENMIFRAELNYFCEKKGLICHCSKELWTIHFLKLIYGQEGPITIKYFWIPISSIESFVSQTTTNITLNKTEKKTHVLNSLNNSTDQTLFLLI